MHVRYRIDAVPSRMELHMAKKSEKDSDQDIAKPTLLLHETLPGDGLVTIVVKGYAKISLVNYGTIGALILNALKIRLVNHQITQFTDLQEVERFIAPQRIWSKSSRTLTVELISPTTERPVGL
jgi:hypothetical protein